MLECYQRYMPKLTNVAEMKDCMTVLLTKWNDLLRVFINTRSI